MSQQLRLDSIPHTWQRSWKKIAPRRRRHQHQHSIVILLLLVVSTCLLDVRINPTAQQLDFGVPQVVVGASASNELRAHATHDSSLGSMPGGGSGEKFDHGFWEGLEDDAVSMEAKVAEMAQDEEEGVMGAEDDDDDDDVYQREDHVPLLDKALAAARFRSSSRPGDSSGVASSGLRHKGQAEGASGFMLMGAISKRRSSSMGAEGSELLAVAGDKLQGIKREASYDEMASNNPEALAASASSPTSTSASQINNAATGTAGVATERRRLAPPLASSSQRQRRSGRTRTPKLPVKFRYHICLVNTTATVNISVSARRRLGVVWKGWGTTLGWFASFVGGMAINQREYLLDLLFHKNKGLGLNIVRYNIPGGFHPDYSPQAKARGRLFFPAGFRPKYRGPWNWTADAQQRLVLLGAKRRGVNLFDAVAYSPPWWMTMSGDVSGNVEGKPNLRPNMTEDFADYLVTVVHKYQSTPNWNVTFNSISPANEPLEWWWKKGGAQEGCGYDVKSLSALNEAVIRALKKRRMFNTSVMLFDSWTSATKQVLLSSSPASKSLRAAGHVKMKSIHGYRYYKSMTPANDAKDFLAASQVVQASGKSIWQSEWGPLGYVGNDLEISLFLARSICQHINFLKVEAWLHYQAINWNHPSWGLIRLPFSYKPNSSILISRQYWVTMHFTKWVTSGSIPLELKQNCAHTILAVYDPKMRRLVFTIVNQKKMNRKLRFILDGFRLGDATAPSRQEQYRTSNEEFYQKVWSRAGALPRSLVVEAPLWSVTTHIVTNVKLGA